MAVDAEVIPIKDLFVKQAKSIANLSNFLDFSELFSQSENSKPSANYSNVR